MSRRSEERGFTMIVAMMVLLVATLLVVGAIAFTGAERQASSTQMKADMLNACAQSARNMFISRVNVLRGNIGAEPLMLDAGVVLGDGTTNEGFLVRGGHFGQSVRADLREVEKVDPNKMGSAERNVQDLSNRLGTTAITRGHYNITATCTDVGTGAQQEIEFQIAAGI